MTDKTEDSGTDEPDGLDPVMAKIPPKKKRGGKVHGEMPKKRLDKRARGGAEHWIAGATKNKGALHRKLHVPENEKIPAKKLEQAEHSSNPTERKEANLAKTLKKLH